MTSQTVCPASLPPRPPPPLCRYSGQRYGATEGRIIQCFLYQRTGKYDNFYAHPLDTVLMYNASVDRVSKFCVYGDENTKQDVSWSTGHVGVQEFGWNFLY